MAWLLAAYFTTQGEHAMTPLRHRMLADMQIRNLSPHTQTTYARQVALFARQFRPIARGARA